MLKLLKYVVILVIVFYAVRTYANYSIGMKFMGCLENEPVQGATKAEMEAIGKRAIHCVDGRVNFVERMWFDESEWLASLSVE